MLYLFDMDGTLISGYMDNPDRDYHTWEGLPNRSETIARLRANGHDIAIVSNQAGVAFGHITEQDVITKLCLVASALGYPAIWLFDGGTPMRVGWSNPVLYCHVCYSDARSPNPLYRHPANVARRKPSGQMIREAMEEMPIASVNGAIFVGDRPEDEAAAQDAGVPFQWAENFFGA